MSLDVSLISKTPITKKSTGIFIRRDGATVELSADEARELYPNATIEENTIETNEVYTDNITHNLTEMAIEVGREFYQALWRPEELDTKTAMPLLPILRAGILKLEANPDHYKAFNPDNGWGNYDQLLTFAKNYEEACRKYPTARVEVSR